MIVVMVAHPDDEVLGCGGTIAKYTKKGEKVISIIFSHDQVLLNPKSISKIRKHESEKVSKILGNEVIFLGIKEGKLMSELKKHNRKRAIFKLLDQKNPDKIFTHSLDDPHPAHRAVAKLVKEYIKTTNKKIEVFAFLITFPFKIHNTNRPKLIVDISDTFELKRQALRCFESQKLWLTYYGTITFLANKFWGIEYQCKYAEVFYKW